MKTKTIPLETLEQQVTRSLEAGHEDHVQALLESLHPADIADIVDRLPPTAQMHVVRLLPLSQAAAVLSETDVGATQRIISNLQPDETRELFSYMSLDDVVEILGEDVPAYQQTVLSAMKPDEAKEARTLLTYPLHSAGRLMSEAFVRLDKMTTVSATLTLLRQVQEQMDSLTDLYILDNKGKLNGVVSLPMLLTATPDQRMADLMKPDPITVTPDTDQEEVAWIVSQYDLFTLPVVTTDGIMIGMVTVDDVIDVLVQEGTEDVLRFGAVQEGATDEAYFTTPLWRTIQRRVGWLLLLFLTGMLTVNVLGYFEQTLSEVVALSFFIPLLIGTGGNTGAQTVSTIVRSLALGEIRIRDSWRVLVRELSGGLLLGFILSIVALGMALLLGNSFSLALVVAISIVTICTWSNVIGALVPMFAEKFGLDPALVSAPLITTLVDATGLAIYLAIARVILNI